jgi:hypothetical protein
MEPASLLGLWVYPFHDVRDQQEEQNEEDQTNHRDTMILT